MFRLALAPGAVYAVTRQKTRRPPNQGSLGLRKRVLSDRGSLSSAGPTSRRACRGPLRASLILVAPLEAGGEPAGHGRGSPGAAGGAVTRAGPPPAPPPTAPPGVRRRPP